MQDEPLLHGDGMHLISVVLPSEFAVDVGVCVVLLDLGFVAFYFLQGIERVGEYCSYWETRCNMLWAVRGWVCEPHDFYENYGWLCIVTGGDSMQYAVGRGRLDAICCGQ